jgi:hypothetical protein
MRLALTHFIQRDKPRRSTPKVYGKTLTVRHPWVEGHVIRLGVSRLRPMDRASYQKGLMTLCRACPLRIEDCPPEVVKPVRSAYFAPLARVRLPQVTTVVGEILRATMAKALRLKGKWPRADSVDVVRRIVESSLKRGVPALALREAELSAEVSRLRVENARLLWRVEVLTATLREETRHSSRGKS